MIICIFWTKKGREKTIHLFSFLNNGVTLYKGKVVRKCVCVCGIIFPKKKKNSHFPNLNFWTTGKFGSCVPRRNDSGVVWVGGHEIQISHTLIVCVTWYSVCSFVIVDFGFFFFRGVPSYLEPLTASILRWWLMTVVRLESTNVHSVKSEQLSEGRAHSIGR